MFFAQNIKFLRKRKGRTQDEVAIALDMKRPTLSGYENGIAEPPMSVLLAFSDYYKISVDTLIRVDLSRLTESQLWQLEHGHDPFVRGTNLRVLATTVNVDNEENIELVNEKAKAGYATGFADPDFVSVLPAFRLPFCRKIRSIVPSRFRVTVCCLSPWGLCNRRVCAKLANHTQPLPLHYSDPFRWYRI